MRLLIIQNKVLNYRREFYNDLVERSGWDVTVLHSGAPVAPAARRFHEIILKETSCGIGVWHRGLRKIAASYDVVVGMFDVRWLTVVSMALFPLARPGLVLWSHGFGRSRKARLLRGLRSWLMRRAEAVLLYDDQTQEELVKDYGFDAERIFVAPNTVKVENSAYDDECCRDAFLYCGRLQARKGVDVALRAFAGMEPTARSKVRFVIVGSGSIEPQLRALASSLGVEKQVEFLGEIHDAGRLRSVFQTALAYVSPGHVGLGVLHSFAYGVPVVTRRQAEHAPEASNMIHGVNSLLYDGSESELVAIMNRLAGEKHLSLELGAQAYQLYRDHRQVRHMTEGFMAAVDCAMNKRRKGSLRLTEG